MRWAEKHPLLKVETGVTKKQKEEQKDTGRQCAQQKQRAGSLLLPYLQLNWSRCHSSKKLAWFIGRSSCI